MLPFPTAFLSPEKEVYVLLQALVVLVSKQDVRCFRNVPAVQKKSWVCTADTRGSDYKLRLFVSVLYGTSDQKYLDHRLVPLRMLQLVGFAAMLFALKLEEICPPEGQDFVYFTNIAYTKNSVNEYLDTCSLNSPICLL